MHLLNGMAKLTTLKRALAHGLPESMQLYGVLHNVINKNPFRVQVLVDQWPDFTSVICRPPLEEMTDPTDIFTNKYIVFSKRPQSLLQMLHDPQSINWSHDLHIEGNQPELGEVLHTISSKHGRHMQTNSYLLYMRDGMKSEELEKLNNASTGDLMFTSLLPQEAYLVSDKIEYLETKHRVTYVERCIQNFPTICVRKKGLHQPIGWGLIDDSGEINMIYNDPAYRNMGIASTLLSKLAATNYNRGFPIFCTISCDNKASRSMAYKAKFRIRGKMLLWIFQ